MSIVAKYKYDGSVYADLIPEFNAEFTDYTVTDEVDSENSNYIIRTIESDSLPTLMRFGTTHEGVGGEGKSSLLEIIKLDTSNLTSMYCMFRDCAYVTSINTDGWNTSKITDMTSIFNGCGRLISLDLSNLDTSSAIYFKKMFIGCVALTSIDTSIWKTNKVIDTLDMFRDCTKLKLLDISNYDLTNVTLSSEMFTGTEKLTDIGMIYCDQSTINKVASLLPTDHNITIWVESDDILQYDQYDHITYKTQKVQDTVHLNSPLLMGDTIEVIDGKTYHVHRYEKVVYDGSVDEGWWYSYPGDWWGDTKTTAAFHSYVVPPNSGYNLGIVSTHFLKNGYDNIVTADYECISRLTDIIVIRINKSKLNSLDKQSFDQWLQANPITVIYELATPYYELISEEPLELTLLDTTDNTINNNSILPSNMTIANKELSTIAIKPSTTYTLSFDKSNEDSEVTIDICGGEQITTVLNRVELTTPSELGSGIRFISSDGCIVSNVRLLEGSLVKEAIPKESFEGLQSSFDEGYIIGENLANEKEDYFYEETGNYGNNRIDFKRNLKANTTYTLVRKISNVKYGLLNGISFYDMAYYTDGTQKQDHNCWYSKDGWYISKYTPTKDVTHFVIIMGNDNHSNGDIRPRIVISDYMIFEGDHTHLSEAELMRYIEKGTSHYEEEDYNHVGKYKVEYKVTGKNKAKDDLIYDMNHSSGDYVCSKNYSSVKYAIPLEKGVYSFSIDGYDLDKFSDANILVWKSDSTYTTARRIQFGNPIEIKDDEIGITWYGAEKFGDISTLVGLHFQIEEGTVATEYEPYKEDIKTYYLSSPLLEGDTIEDVNGVATHVKRREKIVLDGSDDEDWGAGANNQVFDNTQYFASPIIQKVVKGVHKPICDIFPSRGTTWSSNYTTINIETTSHSKALRIRIDLDRLPSPDVDGFKQWLSENPTTVVYELRTPQYEPISTESILCDSYVNGHLDLSNENIPIQKTEFRNFTKELAYLQPSTDYIVKFSSDNIGIAKVYLDSSVKEINVVKGINEVIITTPSTIVNNNIIIDGIGFNVSDVQVIADVIDNGDIKDFDYFKGLQSSFEDGLVTDENDENYGKYKVECKIVGKNKFDGELEYGRYNYIDGIKDENNNTSYMRFPKLIPIKNGSVRATVFGIDGDVWFVVYNTNGGYIDFGKANGLSKFDGYVGYISFYMVQPSFADNWYIQLEEGTQATEYEPYKESIHTLYLNSPLLKGDKLVVHDGKLCHYHKMGMVVLDGSESLTYHSSNGNYFYRQNVNNIKGSLITPMLSDRLIDTQDYTKMTTTDYTMYSNGTSVIFHINNGITTANDAKQWLQANPTTVVYQLAEPYYEPIEPQISQYSFSTVKDGDMEIITALPIEVDLTYRTDINGVSSIEEQIASIQESTDISSIIDEEVDE